MHLRCAQATYGLFNISRWEPWVTWHSFCFKNKRNRLHHYSTWLGSSRCLPQVAFEKLNAHIFSNLLKSCMWVEVCQRITPAIRAPLWAYYLPTFNSCLSTGFHLPIFSKYLKTLSSNFTLCAKFMKLGVLSAVTASTLINTVSKSQRRLTPSVKCVAAIGHIKTLQNVVDGWPNMYVLVHVRHRNVIKNWNIMYNKA